MDQKLALGKLGGGNSYQSHGVGDLGDDDLEGLHAFLLAEVVSSILLEPGFGFLSREAGQNIGLELSGYLLERESMGRTAQRPVGLARDMVARRLHRSFSHS